MEICQSFPMVGVTVKTTRGDRHTGTPRIVSALQHTGTAHYYGYYSSIITKCTDCKVPTRCSRGQRTQVPKCRRRYFIEELLPCELFSEYHHATPTRKISCVIRDMLRNRHSRLVHVFNRANACASIIIIIIIFVTLA